MIRELASVAVGIAVIAAASGPATWPLAPPAKYDHPFRGRVSITTVATVQEANAACAKYGPRNVACATAINGTCYITMVPDHIINQWGPKAQLMRHEVAHCNGWPADHRRD